LAQEVALAPRYIMSIENKGQHPSFQVFYELVTLFQISVDQFFFPDTGAEKTTRRRQLESQLDELEEADLIIMAATASFTTSKARICFCRFVYFRRTAHGCC
jgi:transcriptional regulator with XRE-family HTH domain